MSRVYFASVSAKYITVEQVFEVEFLRPPQQIGIFLSNLLPFRGTVVNVALFNMPLTNETDNPENNMPQVRYKKRYGVGFFS